MVTGPDSAAQRRHSPRREQRIPVRVVGVCRDGKQVDREAEVNQVSSHGVRLTIGVDLPSGTVAEIHNPQTGGSARYRAMWATESPAVSGRGGWNSSPIRPRFGALISAGGRPEFPPSFFFSLPASGSARIVPEGLQEVGNTLGEGVSPCC